MAYSYDHDCPFEAFITNLGKYNEGELVGEWVKFPTTPEKLQEVFERIGIGSQDEFGSVYEEWFITDYDCYVDGLYDKLGEYESLDELNYLASKLDELGDAEYEHFQAAMQISDYTGSIKDLINLTDNLDKYDVLSGIEDYDDLGRYYIEELGTMAVPEHLQNYINYEAYGRDIALDEISDFTDYGYVYDNQSRFVEYYDGDRENIPEEYRVMVSPEEPELSYEEQQEMDSIMLDEATSLAFDIDTLMRKASPEYDTSNPEIFEKQEDLADILINAHYRDLKKLVSPIAEEQSAFSPIAAELIKRIDEFDDHFIGDVDRKLNMSRNLSFDIDQLFRGYDNEYAAMFPDEDVQQTVLFEHLYEGDTSQIKTGLLNIGREKDLREEISPLIDDLEKYEKHFGINTYTVYQIKSGEDYRDYRFEGLDYLEKAGLSVNRENYEPVYAAPLTPGDTLESIYTDLNLYRPDNFHGHSLSISDVVVFQEYGKETAFFCDRGDYKEVPEFLTSENTQEKPEISQEDKGSITFYAAECMEFPTLGEYHENLTLQEAVDRYRSIPAERMNGIKGIGFTLEDGSIYDGMSYPLVEGKHIDLDGLSLVEYFKESPLVREAVADIIRALPDLQIDDRENYLKNAEISLEDDYGMIDGIINNGERGTDKEVQTDKPSVLGQLSQAKKECAERKPPETGKLGKEEPEL